METVPCDFWCLDSEGGFPFCFIGICLVLDLGLCWEVGCDGG